MPRLNAILMIVFVLLFAPNVAAAQNITECDRLASNPPDPDRVTEGVPRSEVDIPAAIAACAAAIEERPEVARFSYQLGRVYFYDGQTTKALESFGRAIDLDYRQAKFLVGLIMTRGYDGVPDDVCRVEELWRASAHQNHPNAQVSYVDFAVNGRFNNCPNRADTDEMESFLDGAAPQLDYIGGLLIANLRTALNNADTP